MSGSQFQQLNEDLNKMLGSTQTCVHLLLSLPASATHCPR